MPKAVLTFSGTMPTYDAVLEFQIPRYSGIDENYSNIRFLDINGEELPYWIEHDENGKKNGYCYVKVPWIGENGISIVMEWGTGVEGRENGDEVFLLFDDFDGDELDTSKWQSVVSGGNSDSSFAISDSKITGTDSNYWHYLNSIINFNALNLKVKSLQNFASKRSDIRLRVRDSSEKYGITVEADGDNFIFYGGGFEQNNDFVIEGEWQNAVVIPNFDGVKEVLWTSSSNITYEIVYSDYGFSAPSEVYGSVALGEQSVDWLIFYTFTKTNLIHSVIIIPSSFWALFGVPVILKLGSSTIVAILKNQVSASETITSANSFSSLSSILHDIVLNMSSSNTLFARVSSQTWNDYIVHDPVTWTVKQLNNITKMIAKSDLMLEALNDTTAYSSALSTSGYVVISFKDTIRILEDITNALEYAILYPGLVINSQQVKNKLVAVEATAIFTERISYLIKEATAKLLEKYKNSELITTASTEKEQLVENIATAYVKASELISALSNAFSHVSKLSVGELLAELERVSSSLQEVVAVLTTLKKSEEIQSASTQEAKKFQSEIQSVLEVTENLMALVATLQKTYSEFAEITKVSEFATEEVISTSKVGENVQSAVLSILEQIRKLNLKMLRTLVDFENFQTRVNFKKFRTLVRKV